MHPRRCHQQNCGGNGGKKDGDPWEDGDQFQVVDLLVDARRAHGGLESLNQRLRELDLANEGLDRGPASSEEVGEWYEGSENPDTAEVEGERLKAESANSERAGGGKERGSNEVEDEDGN